MASLDSGKSEVVAWIREHFPTGEILDVGACDGKWRDYLPEYIMDAVEVWTPSAEAIKDKYRTVFNENIVGLKYKRYDLIIFGDIIEHLSVKDAQTVLEYAKGKCKDMIVAVPFLYPQGELYGNPYERHIQDDLTEEIFKERYKGFEPIWSDKSYCYYHKEIGNDRRKIKQR